MEDVPPIGTRIVDPTTPGVIWIFKGARLENGTSIYRLESLDGAKHRDIDRSGFDGLVRCIPNLPAIVEPRLEEERVFHAKATIAGESWDLDDLLETVEDIADGNVVITDRRMAEFLLSHAVIDSNGDSRWAMGAEPGPNYIPFRDALRKIHETLDKERAAMMRP